jgi:uncharacterized repeat protein (TIGR01451 family)
MQFQDTGVFMKSPFRFFLLVFILLVVFVVVSKATVVTPAYAVGFWYVSTIGNDSNDCTTASTPCTGINGALNKAGFVDGDTIRVAIGSYTGTGDEVVLLNKSATLSGGWNTSFTMQSGMSTIDGQNTRRGITVNSNVTIEMYQFIIQNGFTYFEGGGISNRGNLALNRTIVRSNTTQAYNNETSYCNSYGGGGIYSSGNLTATISNISNNVSACAGAGLMNTGIAIIKNSSITNNRTSHPTQLVAGGGIVSFGTLIISNSNLSGNQAIMGAGIMNGGTFTLTNSTINENHSGWEGGGIYNYSGSMIINSSTITANKGSDAGGIYWNGGTTKIQNTVVAGNFGGFSSTDCGGYSTVNSSGYNLIGSTFGCNYIVGTGDLINVDPKLGQLIGSPGYYPLQPSSVAINAGNPTGCTDGTELLTVDQRGASRVGRCDIGAYEYTVPGTAANVYAFAGTPQRTAPLNVSFKPLQALVLDNIGSPVNGIMVTFTAPSSGASAVFANTGARTTTAITDGSGIATTSLFTAIGSLGTYTINGTVSGISVPASFQITNFSWFVAPTGNDTNDCQTPSTPCRKINAVLGNPGFIAGDTILVAIGTYTDIGTEVVAVSQNVQILGGWNSIFTAQTGVSTIDGQNTRRGIVVNDGVTVMIDHFTIQSGVHSDGGGGIYNTGTLRLDNSTVAYNNVTNGGGGGIYNNLSSLTLNNSTISNNLAKFGVAIDNRGGVVSLNSSTISFNHAFDPAGNSSSDGAVANYANGTITLQNTILAQNSTDSDFFPSPDCGSGGLVSAGYNLIGTKTNCNIQSSTGDLFNLDPKLGSLQDNGNLAQTHALLSSSPAINSGNPAGCMGSTGLLNSDQRGFLRNGRCDIGAYEVTSLEFSSKTVSKSPVSPGDSLTFSMNLKNNSAAPLANVLVTDTLPTQLAYVVNSLSASSGTPNISNGVITWNGSLGGSGTATITFAAKVNQAVLPGTSIVNTSLISAGGQTILRSVTVEINSQVCKLTKYSANPILTSGASGSWDSAQVWDPTVLKDGNTYKMWYVGIDNNGTYGIGYATSSDGITWSKYLGNPVVVPSLSWEDSVFSPIVVNGGGIYRMWYAAKSNLDGKTRINYATSADGISWTKYNYSAVLWPGSYGTWDNAIVSNPTVMKMGSIYHMWYTGSDGVNGRIGHAISLDGYNWLKDSGNPALKLVPGDWDWLQAYSPSIIQYGNQYLLWYSGKSLPLAVQTGYAKSFNGIDWIKQEPILRQGTFGAFDSNGADNSSVIVDGTVLKIWYSEVNGYGTNAIGYATAEFCDPNATTTAEIYPTNSTYLPFVSQQKASAPTCQAYYADNFSDSASGWPINDNNNARFAYVGNEYQIWAKTAGEWWVTPGAVATDYTVSVTARSTSGNGSYGIIFGINPDWTQLYEFKISGNYLSLWLYNQYSSPLFYPFINWTYSPFVNGGNQPNRIKVVRSGTTMSIYVNDNYLTTTSHLGGYVGVGRVGLVAGTNSNIDARFDDFSMYPADCGSSVRAPSQFPAFQMGKPEFRQGVKPPDPK